MKIYNNKIIKTGINKNGKPYTLVGFEDQPQGGRKLTSFDGILADIVEGTDVDGTVTENSENGKTYYNFKMSKRDQNAEPYPLKDHSATTPAPAAGKPVDQSVWDRKDKLMNRMSALKAASTLYEGAGGDKRNDMLQYAEECYKWITGDFEAKEEAPPAPPLPTDDEIDIIDVPF